MKQLFSVLLFVSVLAFPKRLVAQQLSDTIAIFGKALIGGTKAFSNALKKAKAQKLEGKNISMEHLKKSLSYLGVKQTENAYNSADSAVWAYPRYSLSYLIMGYIYLKKNDYVNSNRMLIIYDFYSKKKYNKELNANLPSQFVANVKRSSAEGLNKVSLYEIRQHYKKESWLKNSLELQWTTTVFGGGIQEYKNHDFNTKTYDFSGAGWRNNFLLANNTYFWFNKKNALPYTSNNIGLSFTSAIGANIVVPQQYFPNEYEASITPGLFLKRLYLSPGQFRYYQLNGYSDTYSSTSNYSYPKIGFLLTPEIRWYVSGQFGGILNGYASDTYKTSSNMKSKIQLRSRYIYLKLNNELYSGSAPNANNYTRNVKDLVFGIRALTGKRLHTGFGGFLGFGNISHFEKGAGTQITNLKGGYGMIGIQISKIII